MEKVSFVIQGPIVNSSNASELLSLHGYLAVFNNKIVALEENLEEIKKKWIVEENDIYTLENGEFLMPGLIDTHIHAPQYPNMGLGYDKPLLEWLTSYTFPLEEKYSNPEFASKVYKEVIKRTLKSGTTTACYFASMHEQTALILVDYAIELGQRAFVGKVNMNQNTPVTYQEPTELSLKRTEEFINAVLSKKNSLVKPIITPRFAVSCDMELMKKLADLADRFNLPIQSHISENKDELILIQNLYPEIENYAQVYNEANLLTNKTIMAHGIYLSDKELELFKQTGTSISHCPDSNTCLQSGILDVRNVLKHQVKLGLGSDVGGGSKLSIISAMKSALKSSIHLSFHKENYKPVSYQEVFFLATLGGAQALGVEHITGNFEIGKEFDALVIDMNASNIPFEFKTHAIDELVQQLIYSGDERNIKHVYVAGKKIV